MCSLARSCLRLTSRACCAAADLAGVVTQRQPARLGPLVGAVIERFVHDLRERLAGLHDVLLVGACLGGMRHAREIEIGLADHPTDGALLLHDLAHPGADEHEPAVAILEEDPLVRAREQVADAQPLDLLLREVAECRIELQVVHVSPAPKAADTFTFSIGSRVRDRERVPAALASSTGMFLGWSAYSDGSRSSNRGERHRKPVARALGIAFEPAEDVLEAQRALGLDIRDGNADGSPELPMPTVLVVDSDRTVRFVDVQADYTSRTEVPEILAALDRLN